MKIVTQLTGTVNESGEFREMRGAPHAVLIEIPECKGAFLKLFLGPAGLRAESSYFNTTTQQVEKREIAVPADALMDLFRYTAPELFLTPSELAKSRKSHRAAGRAYVRSKGKQES
jgi:hypothetical protein